MKNIKGFEKFTEGRTTPLPPKDWHDIAKKVRDQRGEEESEEEEYECEHCGDLLPKGEFNCLGCGAPKKKIKK